jgi:hypothetical protein
MKFILIIILFLPTLGICFTEKSYEEVLPSSIVFFLSQNSTPLNKIQEKINIESTCSQNSEKDTSRTPAVVEMFGVKRKAPSEMEY